MATRDKINDELERMSDAELDRVAGGGIMETTRDSQFLNRLNGSTERYNIWQISVGNHDGEIVRAWANLGVQAVVHSGTFLSDGSDNRYFIDGKEVTQDQARLHAMNVTGHYMTWYDWNR